MALSMLRNCRGNRLGKINQFFRDDIGKSAILCEKVHRLERNGLFFRDDYNNTMDMPSPDIQQDNQVCVFIVIPMPTKLLSSDLLGFADNVDEVGTISERIEGKTFLCEFKCHVKCSSSLIW